MEQHPNIKTILIASIVVALGQSMMKPEHLCPLIHAAGFGQYGPVYGKSKLCPSSVANGCA